MKRTHRIALGIIAASGLAASAALAHDHAAMGGGMGPGMGHGKGHAMGPRMEHGKGHGNGQGHGRMDGAMAQLMTPEEHEAFRQKMRAASPEERQKLAAAQHAEMQKRAGEKGITLPEHRAPMHSHPGSH